MVDPDELTPAERIDATREAARSLTRLLEAIERGNSFATPLRSPGFRGRWRPSARSRGSYAETSADYRSETHRLTLTSATDYFDQPTVLALSGTRPAVTLHGFPGSGARWVRIIETEVGEHPQSELDRDDARPTRNRGGHGEPLVAG